jgi:hypothetical protein
MAVDVLEGVGIGIGNRHQLYGAMGRMAGHAGGFVKAVPAQKILVNARRHALQAVRQAQLGDQAGNVLRA